MNDVHEITKIKINFSKGIEYTPTVLFDGVEQETKTFSNKTHQIEELLSYIDECENGGCDVYI